MAIVMNNSAEILFKLVRIGLGLETDFSLPDKVDWTAVIDLSFTQGVVSLAVDGIQKIYDSDPGAVSGLYNPELEDQRTEWMGQTLVEESWCFTRESATRRLVRYWSENGIPATILKGSVIAQYYPVPPHRYSCDLDLFIGDAWERGCAILEKKGININYEIYKDAQFYVKGVYVECHRYLMSIRGNETLRRCELYLRSLLEKGKVQIGTELLYMPPLMFNVIFCVEHARGHLLYDKLILRHICDWMVLRRQDVDWDEFRKRCDEFGFTRFADLLDRLADLIEGKLCYGDMTRIEKRVVDEMLSVGMDSLDAAELQAEPKSMFRRRLNVFFNILKNGWKYKAYNDVSMPVALIRQVWHHFFDRKVKL